MVLLWFTCIAVGLGLLSSSFSCSSVLVPDLIYGHHAVLSLAWMENVALPNRKRYHLGFSMDFTSTRGDAASCLGSSLVTMGMRMLSASFLKKSILATKNPINSCSFGFRPPSAFTKQTSPARQVLVLCLNHTFDIKIAGYLELQTHLIQLIEQRSLLPKSGAFTSVPPHECIAYIFSVGAIFNLRIMKIKRRPTQSLTTDFPQETVFRCR